MLPHRSRQKSSNSDDVASAVESTDLEDLQCSDHTTEPDINEGTVADDPIDAPPSSDTPASSEPVVADVPIALHAQEPMVVAANAPIEPAAQEPMAKRPRGRPRIFTPEMECTRCWGEANGKPGFGKHDKSNPRCRLYTGLRPVQK